jgi:hypothetical protein
MRLVRVRAASALNGHRLRLQLTTGQTVERDLSDVLTGPIFEPIRTDDRIFSDVRVEGGSVAWPNGADICPDVLIWGGPPPDEDRMPPETLRLKPQEL